MRFAHTILWHALPLAFTGAEPEALTDGTVHHRLPLMTGWLDHVVALGANGLQLGPVFAAETHGYDTTDHLRIDPRLGDEDDLRSLIEAAHARGVAVLLDGVFNHVGRSFAVFRRAEAGDAEAARWFRRDGDDWAVFEGHGALVALDHDEPAVLEHVVGVLRHWLALGVDGWRFDAAYAVPTAFWRRVADRVRQEYPHAFLYGEVIHGDYAEFVRASGLDSVTQYELWKATWSSLNDRNLFELAHAVGRHAELLPTVVPMTFVGNHDVTRIASRLTDRRHLPHALTVLMTLPGHPIVYAGDELALTGVKEDRAGGDDAVRPAFPADPAAVPDADGEAVDLHRRLIGVRRRHAWLVDALVEVVRLENELLVLRLAPRDGGPARLDVVLHVGDAAPDYALPEGGALIEGALAPHAAAVVEHGA